MIATSTDANQTHVTLRVMLVAIARDALDGGFESSPFGPFAIATVVDGTDGTDGADALAARSGGDFDAVLIDADRCAAALSMVHAIAADSAVLVVVADIDADIDTGAGANTNATLEWLAQGAEDVLGRDELGSAAFARRVRAAIERKRRERRERTAYATDLATGLPHQQQLIEHISQLLALREREPAPMAVLVLRIEGFVTTASQFGSAAADSLRRKIAVRLRAAVRASDVVAAIDDASYAVLLGSLLAPVEAGKVGAKLAQALIEPFHVGGAELTVAVALGIGRYPEDGLQPELLLRKAIGMALDEPARGRVVIANFHETGGQTPSAANDE